MSPIYRTTADKRCTILHNHPMINNIGNLIVRAEMLRGQGLKQEADICEKHARRLQEKYDLVEPISVG